MPTKMMGALACAWVMTWFCTVAHGNLVGYWTFDDPANLGADATGNNHGTVQGDAGWSADAVFGAGALALDGIGDYINVGGGAFFSALDDDGDGFSIAAWIKYADVAGIMAIFVTGKPNGWTGNGWGFNIDNTGGVPKLMFVTHGKKNYVSGSLSNVLAPNEWVHVAATYGTDGAVDYYVSGQPVARVTGNFNLINTTDNFFIGALAWSGGLRWFEGLIDDLQIFDKPLAAEDLQWLADPDPDKLFKPSRPVPQDGAMIETTEPVLRWVPGSLAVSHRVYLHESLASVSGATPDGEALQGNVTEAAFPIPGLTPGTTYYWRVVEVQADGVTAHAGDVWSFFLRPPTAWDPTPADGISFVHPDQDLSWKPGMATLFHTVYIGASLDEVNDVTAGGVRTNSPAHDPGRLDTGRTYYWRVDEVDDSLQTRKGRVWSFTTMSEVTVTDPNLAGWWTFDEGQGTNAVDWSGHGHHGTLSGPQWIPDGYHGAALAFDGDDFVKTASMTSGNVQTVAMWIQPAVVSNQQFWHGNGPPQVLVEINGNTLRGRVHDGAGNVGLVTGPTPVVGAWTHVAYVYDHAANRAELFVDGVSVGVADAPSASAYTSPRFIGSHPTDRAYSVKGVIDDIRVYDKSLSLGEIQEAMRGDPLLAWDPAPARGEIVDVRDADALRWSAGQAAVSHDVYFGADRAAVAAADRNSPLFRGNRSTTNLSLASLVELGGGDDYWRVDEVEADGTVRKGQVWMFAVPDYLIVEDFESYGNMSPDRVFQTWIDGVGFSKDEFFPADNPGNGTGAALGHDIWSPDSPYFNGQIMEKSIVHGDAQSAPLYYSGPSQIDRTFSPTQNWTVHGVTTLVVHFRGVAGNAGQLYLKINGAKISYSGDPADIGRTAWTVWPVELASVGVDLTKVATLSIGVEGGEAGVLYLDDIRLIKP